MSDIVNKLLLSMFYSQNQDKYVDEIFKDMEYKFKGMKFSEFIIYKSTLYCNELEDHVLWADNDGRVGNFKYYLGSDCKNFNIYDYIRVGNFKYYLGSDCKNFNIYDYIRVGNFKYYLSSDCKNFNIYDYINFEDLV